MHDDAYRIAQSLRNTPTDPYRIFLVEMGFNFNNLDESYRKISEKNFYELVKEKEIYLDPVAKSYYHLMLDEVFGSPPDLTTSV